MHIIIITDQTLLLMTEWLQNTKKSSEFFGYNYL